MKNNIIYPCYAKLVKHKELPDLELIVKFDDEYCGRIISVSGQGEYCNYKVGDYSGDWISVTESDWEILPDYQE